MFQYLRIFKELVGFGFVCLWCFTINPVFASAENPERRMQDDKESIRQASSSELAFTSFAAGYDHACGITSDGKVYCWGNNLYGRLGDGTQLRRTAPVPVVGFTGRQPDETAIAISAGYYHTCALTQAGGVKCWGMGGSGQLGNGANSTSTTPVGVQGLDNGVAAIVIGTEHTCALTALGAVKCWGANGSGQLGVGDYESRNSPADVVGLSAGALWIAAGNAHTCAVVQGGNLSCWGWNVYGQLGTGNTEDHNEPIGVIGLSRGAEMVTLVAAGDYHTCALLQGGTAKCWGLNNNGQLGVDDYSNKTAPTDVALLGATLSSLALGNAHTCGLTQVGGVKCWGSNQNGQWGMASPGGSDVPTDIPDLGISVNALEAGANFSCGNLAGGASRCWGSNSAGQLGIGRDTQQPLAWAVTGLDSGVDRLTAGGFHNCVRTVSGELKCWGYNFYGQLGDGTLNNRPAPVNVVGLARTAVENITGGFGHTCLWTATGGAMCWGANFSGQLGYDASNNSLQPGEVTGLSSGIARVDEGYGFTCALTTGGAVLCWGGNDSGQLGTGDNSDSPTPVAVSGMVTGTISIATGMHHACALKDSGTVQCWGRNSDGQLGNDSQTNSNAPVDVVGLSGVTAISIGNEHSCALTDEGEIKCWGSNGSGRLGIGSIFPTISKVPVKVISVEEDYSVVAAGGQHTCAITQSGAAWCWGSNSKGQVGDGSLYNRAVPSEVLGMEGGVMSLAAGSEHTCALTQPGIVVCWGDDSNAQLGSGFLSWSSIPMELVPYKPYLKLNYSVGQVGSVFSLVGGNFPITTNINLQLNGITLSPFVLTTWTGGLIVFLDTAGSLPGTYLITVEGYPEAKTQFTLNAGAPLRAQVGDGLTFAVLPEHFMSYIYLPLVDR